MSSYKIWTRTAVKGRKKAAVNERYCRFVLDISAVIAFWTVVDLYIYELVRDPGASDHIYCAIDQSVRPYRVRTNRLLLEPEGFELYAENLDVFVFYNRVISFVEVFGYAKLNDAVEMV
jgi:hypothetical protein